MEKELFISKKESTDHLSKLNENATVLEKLNEATNKLVATETKLQETTEERNVARGQVEQLREGMKNVAGEQKKEIQSLRAERDKVVTESKKSIEELSGQI